MKTPNSRRGWAEFYFKLWLRHGKPESLKLAFFYDLKAEEAGEPV